MATATQNGEDCVTYASELCDANPGCEAFGICSGKIQLHGCASTIANNDWSVWEKGKHSSTYARLPGHVNVDEAKCTQHPKDSAHSCGGRLVPTRAPSTTAPTPATRAPTPSPPPYLYTVEGSIDVGTLENSVFQWKGKMYLLENFGCGYIDHAGKWFPQFKGHS